MGEVIARERTAKRTYAGTGDRHPDPLPGAWDQAEPYVAPPRLRDTVNMALYLRRPLLVEGEPGTGKTRLAHAIAWELGYPLKEIYIRSTSSAQDLLWIFDAVRRMYDIQERSVATKHRRASRRLPKTRSAIDPHTSHPDEKYVRLGKLGEAIALSMQYDSPSVVLIDEIDKADIDFPNDLLQVLDRLSFEIDDLAECVSSRRYDALKGKKPEDRRDILPLVIITSNREKELPPPFLRRCLYYYIPFPNEQELKKIMGVHFKQELTPLFTVALTRFWELRDRKVFSWRKPPSTSEFIDWMRMLEYAEQEGRLDAQRLTAQQLYDLPCLEALLKSQSDRDALEARRPAPATAKVAYE